MIEVDNLAVRYGEVTALEGLSLKVNRGECVLITGPSGCGKSTLARCLTGLIPHSYSAEMSGRVVIDGLATTEHTVSQLATHVGLVFQNPATQLFCLTVEEEASFGPRNLGLSPAEVAERRDFALVATGIEHLRRRAVKTLSEGERQRLAIASILAMHPRILILDEPTSNLDLKGTRLVLETLERLRCDHGLTILIIEHRLNEFGKLADRVVIMNGGQIVTDDKPQQTFVKKDLLSRLGVRYPWHLLQDDWTAMIPEGIGPRRNETPLVELKGVEAGYNGEAVLHDLNLAIYPGEFVALVGDNGAGKTTVAKLLAGLFKPRRGKVIFNGAGGLDPGQRVGLLFQNPLHQLFCDTVGEEVAFGPRNFGLFSDGSLDEVLSVTGLSGLRARNVYALSSGQQQRTAVAAVIALKPGLLILDEPTMGQDWGHLSSFMDFLIELNRQWMTILLITHDYKLICRYAKRIVFLENGHIVADGPPRLPTAMVHRGSGNR